MNPAMPRCQVCGGLAYRQYFGGVFCLTHDKFNAPVNQEKAK